MEEYSTYTAVYIMYIYIYMDVAKHKEDLMTC